VFDVLRIDLAQDMMIGTSLHSLLTKKGAVTVGITWKPCHYTTISPSASSSASSSSCLLRVPAVPAMPAVPVVPVGRQGVLGSGEWGLSSIVEEGVASLPACVFDFGLFDQKMTNTLALKFHPLACENGAGNGMFAKMTYSDRPLISFSQRRDLFTLTSPIKVSSSEFVCQSYSKVRTLYSKPKAKMEVVEAMDKVTSQCVCIKRIGLTESSSVNNAIAREAMLSNIVSPCPHTVTHHASYSTNKTLFLVMDMVDGCTLQTLVDMLNMPDSFIAYIIREVLTGLKWLHQRHISHRDLKGENILLDANNGKVLLVDFGASHVACEGNEMCGEFVGTLPFLPPEIAVLPQQSKDKRQLYDGCAADVFSLGMVCHSLFAGEIFHLRKLPKDVKAAAKYMHKAKTPSTKGMSPDLANFVKSCLVKNPHKRATVRELLSHPFLDNACPHEMWIKFVSTRMWEQ
jgi:hypothetical protein